MISAHPHKWGGLLAEGGIVGKVQGRLGQVWGSIVIGIRQKGNRLES